MKLFKLPVVLGVALFCTSHFILAQEPQSEPQSVPDAGAGQQSGGRHHGPPPEAYTACEGKAEGTAASFINHRGETVNGVCQADRSGRLVVRRDRSPK